MTRYRVHLGIRIHPTDAGDVDVFTDAFAGQLLALDPEAELMGSAGSGLFQVWVHEDAASLEDAVRSGSATVRCAGHAAGADTSAWPSADAWPAWVEARSVEAHVVDDETDRRADDGDLVRA